MCISISLSLSFPFPLCFSPSLSFPSLSPRMMIVKMSSILVLHCKDSQLYSSIIILSLLCDSSSPPLLLSPPPLSFSFSLYPFLLSLPLSPFSLSLSLSHSPFSPPFSPSLPPSLPLSPPLSPSLPPSTNRQVDITSRLSTDGFTQLVEFGIDESASDIVRARGHTHVHTHICINPSLFYLPLRLSFLPLTVLFFTCFGLLSRSMPPLLIAASSAPFVAH